jgi:predicted house-cleaning NTP pyrophosphatase (Maf/HAM1 superfamily)
MTEKNFILASGSVPRRQLLEQIGYTPKLVDPADIDETTGKYEE